MKTYRQYRQYLTKSLQDPTEAAAYLEAVLEDDDDRYTITALKTIAEAQQQTQSDFNWGYFHHLLTHYDPSMLLMFIKAAKALKGE